MRKLKLRLLDIWLRSRFRAAIKILMGKPVVYGCTLEVGEAGVVIGSNSTVINNTFVGVNDGRRV